jgi:hypothetical protein
VETGDRPQLISIQQDNAPDKPVIIMFIGNLPANRLKNNEISGTATAGADCLTCVK